jgi:large subunit ribosomal protein L21
LYAIIKTGGKQYRVSEGDTIEVERLAGEVGQDIEFQDVLFVGGDGQAHVGAPAVEGAHVVGTILAQKRGAKVLVFKFKKRKMYRKLRGHRQELTSVKISSVQAKARKSRAHKKEAEE